MRKSKEELDNELCNHCKATEFGSYKVNTCDMDLCYGNWCDEAYQTYLESLEGEDSE